MTIEIADMIYVDYNDFNKLNDYLEGWINRKGASHFGKKNQFRTIKLLMSKYLARMAVDNDMDCKEFLEMMEEVYSNTVELDKLEGRN